MVGGSIYRQSVVLAVSILLHVVVWKMSPYLDISNESEAVPINTIEVSLAAAPAPTSAQTPVQEKKDPPKPVTPPKPKPVPKPVPKPKPEVVPEASEKPVIQEASKDTQSSPSKSSEQPTSQGSSTSRAQDQGSYEGPKSAAYLHNPKPAYPAEARRMELEGRVILHVQVLATGHAGHVSVAKSSGHEVLDECALEAVRQWKFIPAKRNGEPVESIVNVPINFDLRT